MDDQFGTHTVGTGAVGARSLIGLLIGGLIANSKARRDARALDQSPHRWAVEAVRWCAAARLQRPIGQVRWVEVLLVRW